MVTVSAVSAFGAEAELAYGTNDVCGTTTKQYHCKKNYIAQRGSFAMDAVQVSFLSHQPSDFDEILGPSSKACVLADAGASGLPLYHEACIYHAPSGSVFVTSNQMPNPHAQEGGALRNAIVKLFRVYDSERDAVASSSTSKIVDISFTGIGGAMLNGGVNLDSDHILLCAQGSKDPRDPAGIIKLDIPPDGTGDTVVETVVGDFYGIPFNSVNDVIVHPKDSSIWFTDPPYGFHQGIRPAPQLPNQVYRYNPMNRSVRVVADGFVRPNGLCFSPSLDILYVTDTGAIHGSPSVPFDQSGPSHIYAFDIVYEKCRSEPFLTNRRVFAYAPGKVPDGIKCDTRGNVYAGCGDGVEVWNPNGVLIGTIHIPGGVANFCFGEKGVVYACNETRLLKIQLNRDGVKGALLEL